MQRTVLYIDPPAFCTTVEGLVAPALRERPVAVAAPGADRATILALSLEARFAGITRGMPVSKARKIACNLDRARRRTKNSPASAKACSTS